MNYKLKYLKYKNKYFKLSQKGGTIIPNGFADDYYWFKNIIVLSPFYDINLEFPGSLKNNSIIYDNGTSVGIGTTTVNQKVSIYPGTTGGISLQDIDSETRAYFFIDNTNPTYSTGIRTQNYYLDFDDQS